MKKSVLQNIVAEAVRKGVQSALKESAPKVRKITRTQLAEGVRKALRMALNESNGMPGGAMPAPGAAAGAPASAPTTEASRGSSTFGQVPPPEDLQAAIDDLGGWSMDLKGQDSLIFDYAMLIAGLSNPDMNTGEGMHQVLVALMDTPAEDELPDSIPDADITNPKSRLNQLLDAWGQRYFEKSLPEAGQSLASSILEVLGFEWI
jgi:hypothetical protein